MKLLWILIVRFLLTLELVEVVVVVFVVDGEQANNKTLAPLINKIRLDILFIGGPPLKFYKLSLIYEPKTNLKRMHQ